MKQKRIALVAIMMMVVLGASAQYEPGKWSMQIKFGFGASQLTNMEKIPMDEGKMSAQWKSSSTIGLDVEYQVSKLLGLSLGVNRTNQGGGWENFTDASNIKYEDPRIDLDYINVPLIANFYVYKGLALKAGLQAGFLVDADFVMMTKSNYEGRDLSLESTLEMDKDCQKVDFSIPVGISYEFRSHFVLDARYNIGLTKVNKESIFGSKDSKNGVLMFTFGYKFDL